MLDSGSGAAAPPGNWLRFVKNDSSPFRLVPLPPGKLASFRQKRCSDLRWEIGVEDPIDWIYNEVGKGEHQAGVVL
jgi:hypothetical protein